MTPIQAAARGVECDPESWEQGRADGAAGRPWVRTARDLLAYASGYVEGAAERRQRLRGDCCEGERAQPEEQR